MEQAISEQQLSQLFNSSKGISSPQLPSRGTSGGRDRQMNMRKLSGWTTNITYLYSKKSEGLQAQAWSAFDGNTESHRPGHEMNLLAGKHETTHCATVLPNFNIFIIRLEQTSKNINSRT